MRRVYFSHRRRKTTGVAVLALVGGLAAWALSSRSVAQSTAGQVRTTSTIIDRAPTWAWEPDPYETFSAQVGVDTVRNELVAASPKKILVYDRQANTPRSATLTEPKRIIAGPNTQMSDNCGLYVDSKNGEIYTISNDISNLMTVFGSGARGDVEPVRRLITPQTVYGLAVDDENQELYMTVGHPPAVFAWPKGAKGNDPAHRILEGNSTRLAYPHGVAADPKNQLLFVANNGAVADSKDGLAWRRWPISIPGRAEPLWGVPCQRADGIDCQYGGEWYRRFEGNVYKFVGRGTVIPGSGRFELPSITVYPLKANGDVAPLRIIQGSKSQLDWPMHIIADSEHGEVYVANAGGSITVYRITDNGDVAPIRTLKGPKTGIKNPVGVYVDIKNDELVVTDLRTHSASIFRRTADGDTPPLRVIRSGPVGVDAPALGRVTGISYDTRRDQILAPN